MRNVNENLTNLCKINFVLSKIIHSNLTMNFFIKIKLTLTSILFFAAVFNPAPSLALDLRFQSEIQWTICEKSALDFLSKMNVEFEAKSDQKISFLDTNTLDYLAKGIIFRVIQKKDKIKSTVKNNIENPSTIDWEWLKQQNYKCENNVYGTRSQFSCSIDFETVNIASDEKIFNDSQIQMVSRLAGIHFDHIDLEKLKTFGPLNLRKWKSKKFDLTFEIVEIPGGLPVMELSTRVDEKQQSEVQENINELLKKQGILLCAKQGGRTKNILSQLTQ